MTDREELESVCKRRGFIWQSSEIYGGETGFYDYGHLGALLKDNWETLWKDYFLGLDDNYYMIYTPNILPYRALEASGHVDHFSDVLIRCKKCGASYRGDHIIEDETGESAEWMNKEEMKEKLLQLGLSCPSCGGDFDEPEDFNMMFSLDIGPTGDKSGFLRPETAQGTYMNFRREYQALRKKMPMGLATIGRAFRNEISPRQGVFRQREFVQAELQIFFVPGVHEQIFEERYEDVKGVEVNLLRVDDVSSKMVKIDDIDDLPKFYLYHLAEVYRFYVDDMELKTEEVRMRELSEEEKAFYNKIHFDVEVDFGTLGGWKEVSGLHYRGDYDLSKHQKESGKKMSIPTDDGRKVPHVIELSFGVDRNVWSVLDRGYHSGERDWIDIPDKLAPFQVAVFPLVRKDGLPEKSRDVFDRLESELRTFWDKSGSIGKRYARQDEIGTPYCITIDYDTMKDDTVTVREIESMEQIRVDISELNSILRKIIEKEESFEDYL